MRTTYKPTKTKQFIRRAAGAVAASAAVLALFPAPAAAQSAPIPSTAKYACDFENSYCDFSEQSKLGDAPPSARRSSFVGTARSGSSGVRLHTEPGDNNVHGSGTWERDDLSKAPDSSYCNEGQEEWWAFSVMFPSDYVFPPSGMGGGILDFHHNSSSGLANLGLEVRGESGMRISGYGGSTINGGQYRYQIADPWGAVNNVTRNVWYDFVFHVRWTSQGNGISEAWLNGKKIMSYTGATLYSGISCYLKLANYHDATGQPSSIIYDRVVRGASAADVATGPLEGVNGAPAPSVASTGGTSTGTSSGGSTSTSGSGSGSTTVASGSGSAPSSATMDSSSYISNGGDSVTFTARILGNNGTPSGTVKFTADGNPIAGCTSIGLAGGAANCTTSALGGGSHAIVGVYSGDGTYAPAQAGPITQTVNGGTAAQPMSLPASFGMDSSNYTSSVGEAVTFTATIPGAGGSVAFQDNGAAMPGCGSVAVSSNGVATCTSSTLTAGTHAVRAIYSGSGSYAAGVAGPITQAVSANAMAMPVGTAASGLNVQGLWWGGPSESGWGLHLTQQGSIVFATWFTYDKFGNGQWLVLSNGVQSGNTFSGTLYRTTGPAYDSGTFDPSQVHATPVGNATLTFSDANNGMLVATVDGVNVSKPIVRQMWAAMPTCMAGGMQGSTPNYQDLWWRPNGTESGWGLNLAHEGSTMFMTWFTYDTNGQGMWLVASNITQASDGSWSGTLYRTTGPSFDTPQWNPQMVNATAVGQVRFAFSDANNGTFSYTLNGVQQSKPITREVFSSPATVCRM